MNRPVVVAAPVLLYPLQMTSIPSPPTYQARLDEIVHRFPDRIAFRLKTPEGYREVSYAEVHRQAFGTAAALIRLGFRPGTRMAILSENRPEWVIAWLGIYFAGGTAVPLDPQISPAEWLHLLDDSAAQVVFVSGSLRSRLQDAVRSASGQPKIVCLDAGSGAADPLGELKGLVEWATCSPTPPPVFPESRMSDVLAIIYTSGTTGKPKGVMLTQDNIVGELDAILTAVHAEANDAILCLLPLHHVLAAIANFLIALYVGAQVVFADTLKRAEILQALQDAGITILATVPQFFYLFHDRIKDELAKKSFWVRGIFRAALAINRFSRARLHLNLGRFLFPQIHRNFGRKLRLFVSGGSAFDPEVAREFSDLGFTILQGYGLTETTGACTITRIENNVIGSVGPALPGMELSVLDPDEHGVGEVLIRGRVVMKGYYRNPDADREVMENGWFHSGDLGRLDSRGNLYITGRKKEVIVLPNGKNIYPDELETHYLHCPYIQEIAVLGIAESTGHGTSEQLHGVVVPNFDYLKAKKIANAREILRDEIGRLSNQLPTYKRLMSYQIQKDPLPRTTTRKIKRLELKRLIEHGQLQEMESRASEAAAVSEDKSLMESAVGQVVLDCLRGSYHRVVPIDAGTNIELDLGFDSMQRVELMASLANALNVNLPDSFGADIHTIRDLIRELQQQVGAPAGAESGARPSWQAILSETSLSRDTEAQPKFTGPGLTLIKFLCLKFLYYLVFRVFLRLESRGVERLPHEGAFLLCPNHLSYLDSFIVLSILPYHIFRRMFFVGASEYFTAWPMKILGRLANIIPVDPDTHLLRAMKVGAIGLRQGRILCIFPEGARSFDGELKDFKKGAAILACEVGVPMVPVAIQGTYEVWARDSLRIRPHKVRVGFGSPLTPNLRAGGQDPYQSDTGLLQEEVRRLLVSVIP
jgi:long-chain acyl-CoA synthetase